MKRTRTNTDFVRSSVPGDKEGAVIRIYYVSSRKFGTFLASAIMNV